MWTKIKSQIRDVRLIEEFSSTQSINLIDMINVLIRRTGLLSFSTVQKVHWLANFATIAFFTAYVLQIIALYKANEDPERLFECFSVLSFCGMGVLKLISLRLNHKQWRYLLTQISSLENEQLNSGNLNTKYECDPEDTCTLSIHNYTNDFKRTSRILTRMYSFTAVIFILSPFAEHFFKKFRGVESVGYPHILPIWSPLDTISPGYTITVACECIASVYCVCVHIAFDLTAVGIMIFICGQFSLLRDCSGRIGGRGNMYLSKQRDDRAHFRIVQCHRTHNLLINAIGELDKLLKNILGVYFFVATLTLCSVALRINSEMSVMQLLSLLQYMCATLTQLFLFCRYGDTVLNESSVNMGQGPFVAAYWCLSPRIRRELCILGAGMMRPRRLRAGPFHSLDLPSFIQVVRAAYSYYAVLGNKE